MSSSSIVAELHEAIPVIGPSLLAADFGNLENEVRRLEESGAKVLHLDVMDGHFVPNLSFGIPVVQAVRRATELPLDAHLMISDPDRYLEAFRDAGADLLTFHVEAVDDPNPLLRKIREMGAGAGIAISPPTPVTTLQNYLDECDLVLTMSVMPGFGGQEFDPIALEKLRWLQLNAPPEVMLSVDGGINPETIGPCAEAGAEMFIVGTALLNHGDYRQRMNTLADIARAAVGARS